MFPSKPAVLPKPDLARPTAALPVAVAGVPNDPSRRPQHARFQAADLLGRAKEAIIEHNGREYRLRLTSQGKLLLTA